MIPRSERAGGRACQVFGRNYQAIIKRPVQYVATVDGARPPRAGALFALARQRERAAVEGLGGDPRWSRTYVAAVSLASRSRLQSVQSALVGLLSSRVISSALGQ